MKASELDTLLSRGGLSGATRERILERVLAQTHPTRLGRRATIAASILVPAAACALLFASGMHGNGQVGGYDTLSLRARGGPSSAVRVEVECTGGALLACPRGSRLVFRAWPGDRPGYLVAFADPSGGGERIWYFSSDSTSPRLGNGWVERAVRIGDEHRSERYDIHVLIAARPLSRAEAASPNPPSLIGSETFAVRLTP
jgi:hypothetical protein